MTALRFDDCVVEEYGWWVDMPAILPVGSEIYLPTPGHWEWNDPIEIRIEQYILDEHGVLQLRIYEPLDQPYGVQIQGDSKELLKDLIAIGWIHHRYVWPYTTKETYQ